jgi:hypothetical protein
MYQLLIVHFGRPQKPLVDIGGNDFSGDQTVLAETIDGLELPTFEEQISIFDKFTVNL